MTWIADKANRRVYDPEARMELFVDHSGSDRIPTFRLEGPNGKYYFTAEMVFPKLSEAQRRERGLLPGETVAVWQAGSGVPSTWRSAIKEALLAYKASSGFHYPKSQYFVQFGQKGELESA